MEVVLIGFAVCGWLYWFMCRHMDYTPKQERIILRSLPYYARYFFILVWEIIKSNLAVIRIILSPKMENEPTLVRFKTDLRQELGRVFLANSITLTPGTFTIRLEDDEYLVHALDRPLGEDLDKSIFVKELEKLEERA